MNIYAVKDRLIGYFQRPFSAENTNEVLAALALNINNPEATNDIAQAPQHFELWQLGQVTETGHIEGRPEFICDIHTLIRPRRQSAERRETEIPGITGSGLKPSHRPVEDANSHQRAPADPSQAQNRQGEEKPRAPGRTA